jgi:hypothetical protein
MQDTAPPHSEKKEAHVLGNPALALATSQPLVSSLSHGAVPEQSRRQMLHFPGD